MSIPSNPQQKLQNFEIAKKTAIADGKRKTNLKAGVPIADTAKNNLEAAKARGRAVDPISDLIDYGDDDLIGFGSFDDQIDYTDDAYSGMLNTKPVAVRPGSPANATSTAVTTTSRRSSTTKNIIKGVETANDLVSSKSKVGLKAALAASSLGFAGGYIANRNSTRR